MEDLQVLKEKVRREIEAKWEHQAAVGAIPEHE